MRDLGTLGGTNSHGAAINNSGQVTGRADLSGYDSHPFRWSPSGVMEDLGALSEEPGSTNGSWGTAINTLGQVTGVSLEYGGQRASAFRWTPSGGMQPVGADGRWAVAVAINDLGEVAGDDQLGATLARPTRSDGPSPAARKDLGTLGKSTYRNATGSHASSMNAIGHVVGDYDDLGPGGSGATRAMNHYSFHIIDPTWGHVTIKISGHPSFGAQVMQRPRLRRGRSALSGDRLHEGGQLLHTAQRPRTAGADRRHLVPIRDHGASEPGDRPVDLQRVPVLRAKQR